MLDLVLVLAEDICSKGAVSLAPRKINHVLYARPYNDRQNRAKDLLAEQAIILILNQHQRRLDEQLGLIRITTSNNLSLGFIQKALDPLERPQVDNARDILRVLGASGIEFLPVGNDGLDKLVLLGGVNNGKVRRQADLAIVQGLSPGYSPSSELRVGISCDEDGVLSSEFEDDGSEVLSGGGGDDTGDMAVSGVEDLVPFLRKESGGLGDTAVDDLESVVVKVLLEERGDDSGSGGGVLGGLDDGGVTGSDGAHSGTDSELEGEIERPGNNVLISMHWIFRVGMNGATYAIISTAPKGTLTALGFMALYISLTYSFSSARSSSSWLRM